MDGISHLTGRKIWLARKSWYTHSCQSASQIGKMTIKGEIEWRNQNSSYSVQIGKTTFIVCVKQSETAKKPIEKMFKDMCRHEVTRDFLADNLMNLEKLPKTS